MPDLVSTRQMLVFFGCEKTKKIKIIFNFEKYNTLLNETYFFTS